MSMTRLYRVILPVDDIDPSAQFYSTLLGQPGVRVSPGRHYFLCGETTLALYSPKADGDRREPRPNFDHVYFAVDDLGKIHARATRLGTLSDAIGDGNLPMGHM